MSYEELPERFHDKTTVDPATGCILWTACTNIKGYGSFGIAGRKTALAHRVAYEAANGKIPDGLEIDHPQMPGVRIRSGRTVQSKDHRRTERNQMTKTKIQSLGEHWRRRMTIIALDELSEVTERTRLALRRMIARDALIEKAGL